MRKIQITRNNTNGENIGRYNNRDNVNRYLKEIGKLNPLTREEEYKLFERVKLNKDKAAIDLIMKHNLLFVVSIAKRYGKIIYKSSLTIDDLINEGNIGLHTAIEKFDTSKGFKFITYAVWWIRFSIGASINRNIRNIRIPTHAIDEINKFKIIESELEQKLGREPYTSEIFEAIGDIDLTNENIQMYSSLINQSLIETSLNQTLFDDSESTLLSMLESDQIKPDIALINQERKDLAIGLLKTLPEDLKEYIIAYFGLGDSLQLSITEIARKYNKEEQFISNKIKLALRHIRVNNREIEKYFFPTPDYKYRKVWSNKDLNTTFCI